VIYGTAMGRLVFYEIKDDKETVPLEYLQELIWGISHSSDGRKIYISVGDIEGIVYFAQDLTPELSVQLIENADDQDHKHSCERAFTLLSANMNLVLQIKLKHDEKEPPAGTKPLTLTDFNTQVIEKIGDFEFDFNSIPFDFDGSRFLWMDYESKHKRVIWMFEMETQTKKDVMKLAKKDGLIYFVKMKGDWLYYVHDNRKLVKFNMTTGETIKLTKTANDIIALQILDPIKLRYLDKINNQKLPPIWDDEESKNEDVRVLALDESGNVYIYDQLDGRNPVLLVYNIKKLPSFPTELKKKDLFGMGYPYMIHGYGKYVAVATDFGLLLFSI